MRFSAAFFAHSEGECVVDAFSTEWLRSLLVLGVLAQVPDSKSDYPTLPNWCVREDDRGRSASASA